MILIQDPTSPCNARRLHNLSNSCRFQEASLVIDAVFTWSWFPNAFYLGITFGLTSLFTVNFVVDCLVNPSMYSDICFYQWYLKTIILQSLGFKSCIHCDLNTSHLHHYAKANHKNVLIQLHVPYYYYILFPP